MDLLGQGFPVKLVEARSFLGGRAFSFVDRKTGVTVDNGQHVIVGCCTHFIRFLKRLGVSERWYLQPKLHLKITDRRGKAGVLKSGGLPPPFHLFRSFWNYSHLGRGEKMRVLLALARARFTDRYRPDLERLSFYHWLKQQGQSERAIQNIWNLLVKPTLNDDVRDVSASMGLMIVQEGMLNGYHNSDVGYAVDGLLPSIGEPARERLSSWGCQLVLGSPVKRILGGSDRISAVELVSGAMVKGDVWVSALPPDILLRLLPEAVVNAIPVFSQLAGLETSPIVNIHLFYDRLVMDEEFLAIVDSPLQWVFNKSRILKGSNTFGSISGDGQYLCISVSAAWEYIDRTREEIAAAFIDEMAQVFPAARNAMVLRCLVVKQRNATFRCLPGANRLRPDSATPVSNLFLAGEWTNTGWPSTMESAVRSGYNAAHAIVSLEAVWGKRSGGLRSDL
jgi:squalene-associated FAD-dependent desaturase